MLTDNEKHLLLNKLPNLELSYDKIIHKKVFDNIDYYILIPQGIKSIVWFTYFKEKYICVLISLNKYNKFENIKICSCCFNEEIAKYNTIFIGYEFYLPNKSNIFFTITDILYYKETNYKNYSYNDKIILLENIFKNDIKQLYLTKTSIIIGLPIITTNLKNLEKYKHIMTYKLGGILYIQKDLNEIYGISYYNIIKQILATFQITSDAQNDIYNMFIIHENNIIFYDILLINSYKNSVFMNNLFRNIKENNNLDLLEESDSENEFENITIDKYVNLNKKINIKCEYCNKFKKWIPIEISKENIISKKDLLYILKK